MAVGVEGVWQVQVVGRTVAVTELARDALIASVAPAGFWAACKFAPHSGQNPLPHAHASQSQVSASPSEYSRMGGVPLKSSQSHSDGGY